MASFSTSVTQLVTFELTYDSMKDLDPRAAPRCLVLCGVI